MITIRSDIGGGVNENGGPADESDKIAAGNNVLLLEVIDAARYAQSVDSLSQIIERKPSDKWASDR